VFAEGTTATCPVCGQQYKLQGDPPEWGWFLGGVVVGMVSSFFLAIIAAREIAKYIR